MKDGKRTGPGFFMYKTRVNGKIDEIFDGPPPGIEARSRGETCKCFVGEFTNDLPKFGQVFNTRRITTKYYNDERRKSVPYFSSKYARCVEAFMDVVQWVEPVLPTLKDYDCSVID